MSKDFSYTLLDPKDLQDFTGLSTSTITQKQSIAISVDWSVVRWHLEGMYGEVEDGEEDGLPSLTVRRSRPFKFPAHRQIMNAVRLVQMAVTVAELRWESSTSNDMIADSALAILLGIDSSPATVKRE